MPRAKAKAHDTLTIQLATLEVESELGILRECTVALSGVPLKGHTVMIDRNGAVTQDEYLCVKKLPIYTDAKTLETLMAAASSPGGKRPKVREDHDDSIGARAGFADAFKLSADGKRVVADLHIFDSYRHRAVVLEAAAKTPEKIGLSIDFTPLFELTGDHALMRVKALHAVDIVDEGAITPNGLLLSVGVDTEENSGSEKLAEQKPITPMADPKKEETPAAPDSLAALTQLVAALGAKVDGCMATIGKLAMPAPAAAAATGDDKELRASVERMTLAFTQQGDQLKAIIAANAQAKKERALLGLVPSDRVRLGSAPAEDIEAAVAKQKNYIDLVRDVQTSEKLGAGAAHAKVRASKEGNEAYQMHLAAKGVVRMVA